MISFIIVIYTIVPLVSWAYVNVARALKMLNRAVLAAIIAWFATAEMDIMVKVAVKRVSNNFFENFFTFKFNYHAW